MSNNKLAIVIPYYKIDFFEKTLASVASQTDKRFTLYIGNDASPHDPLPLIQKHFPEGNYQYFDYKDNLGGKNLAMQWERILENVTEEWFQILGDDDVISPNMVETFYKYNPEIERADCQVIKMPQLWIDENDRELNALTEYPQLFDSIYNWKRKFIYRERASLSEHIFRNRTFQKYRFQKFPLAWASDDAAVMDIAENKPIFFLKDTSVSVRCSNKSISGSEDNIEQKLSADFIYQSYLLKNHYRKLPKDYIRKTIKNHINYAYRNNSPLSVNLIKLYLYLGDYKSLLSVPKIYFYLLTK